MKVRELIKMLEEVGVDKEIRFSCVIESGRSFCGCLDGTVSISEGVMLEKNEDGNMEVVYDEKGNEIVEENVVVLRVEGDEDWFE